MGQTMMHVVFKKVAPIVVSTIVLDIATKNLADSFGWAVINRGVSGGVGEQVSPYVLIGLGLVSMVLIWSCFWKRMLSEKGDDVFKQVGFSLWLGGALANMIDRIMVGGVRDWIQVPFFRVYNNVADWVFFVGLCMGAWVLLKSYIKHAEAETNS